jgi:glycosyltransferase involved in cell wall biosynthesis
MRILIDSFNLRSGLTLNEIFFLDKCFQLLMKDHPEHEWLYGFNVETKGAISLLPVGIKKAIAFKKIQPDVFITSIGSNRQNYKSKKQIVFYNQQSDVGKNKAITLGNAHTIVATSEQIKRHIPVEPDRVKIIHAAPSSDVSVSDWSEKLSIKTRYSDGRDFFLCYKNISKTSEWEEILKAFSIFKKWQQSSFQLLLACEIDEGFREEFELRIASYKYRSDVKIIETAVEDVDRIMPSAFGVVCAEKDLTGLCILNALKAEVPVIASPHDLFDEKISGSVLPALISADELSRQLINIYRDERMKEIMVEKGKQSALQYSWEKAAARWYECIQ